MFGPTKHFVLTHDEMDGRRVCDALRACAELLDIRLTLPVEDEKAIDELDTVATAVEEIRDHLLTLRRDSKI